MQQCLHQHLPNTFPRSASLREQSLVTNADGFGGVCAAGTSARWSSHAAGEEKHCPCLSGAKSSAGHVSKGARQAENQLWPLPSRRTGAKLLAG